MYKLFAHCPPCDRTYMLAYLHAVCFMAALIFWIMELGIKCRSITVEMETDGEENVGLFHLETMDELIPHYSQ